MLKLAQFRYYNDESENNQPLGNKNLYCSNTIFTKYKPIRLLGILTLPGTKFYINLSLNPIIIGATGIFEVNCKDTTAVINSIRFAPESMDTINTLANGYLIIDILYGEEGEE